ncbi:MAG: FAD binding domain-containing protein [Actinomycetota bacterium]|nr:FAD binding domain-containing protein [Actinomycetota bacterium]
MTVTLPASVDEAVAALAARPTALVLAGGTDAMVEVNAGAREVSSVVALRDVAELRIWRHDGADVVLGAGLTYTDLLDDALAALVPALAQAARTVGSPQIRNAGTIGGNLATASPAGDTLPVLAALDATVELVGTTGGRAMPVSEFILGPKRNALQPGELVVAVRVPVARGPQQYRKVGVRNAMVIAVASVALVVDADRRTVACALGSVGPVPLRAPDAERWVADRIDWDALALPEPDRDARRFGELVADASLPIDDHRGTAAYRRHAVAILAGRSLRTAIGPAGR